VKPANILLRRPDQSPVLIDFGLAIDLAELTDFAADLSGTPFYMAPERGADAPPDPALGCLCTRRDGRRWRWRSAKYADRPAVAAASKVERRLRAKGCGRLNAFADADLTKWVARLLDHETGGATGRLEDARAWTAA